jgi:uncharacterized protein (TIGR00159 family)
MLFGIKDIIDILLVAFILFAIYRILRRSGASNLFWGILAFIFTWLLVSYVFHLELTSALFDRFVSVGAIALIVIFQEEIRSFFYRIGARFNVEHFKNNWSRVKKEQSIQRQINAVSDACEHMSSSKTGALIVITNQQELKAFADTGEMIDAAISARLIENIFFKNTPLHDGALIIREGRVWSAACILPISKRTDLPKHYGLRHRAALGLTEKTDATAIVVSEETGKISVAQGDTIKFVNKSDLEIEIAKVFGIGSTMLEETKK